METYLNEILLMLQSLRSNFCSKTRKDRKYLKARISVVKHAIDICYEYVSSISQEVSLDSIKREVKAFKLGTDGRDLRRVIYMVEKLKESIYGKNY